MEEELDPVRPKRRGEERLVLANTLVVVLNWTEELKRLVPTND